jgi:hypothetical protein
MRTESTATMTHGRIESPEKIHYKDNMKQNIKSEQRRLFHQPFCRVETVVWAGASRLVPMCPGLWSGETQLWPSFRTDCQSLIGDRSAMADAC